MLGEMYPCLIYGCRTDLYLSLIAKNSHEGLVDQNCVMTKLRAG